MQTAGQNAALVPAPQPPTATLDIFSALATCLSGLAAAFNNSYRYWVFGLAALNCIFTLVVVAMRIDTRFGKKIHKVPLVGLIGVLCVVSLALSAWGLTHPNSPSPTSGNQKPAPAAPIVQESHTVYNSTTSGTNSSINNGDNNVNSAGTLNERKSSRHR